MNAGLPPTADDLRLALEEGAFLFYYQPKVSFVTGQITGGEALIRWRKRDGGIVPPGVFIPVAEATGFISTITERMFPRLVDDWQHIREVAPQSHVAFNVSPKDLDRDALVKLIESSLDAGAITSEALRLEVTEAASLSGSDVMRGLVERLMQRGVAFAMDDFGTGYASLDALRRLPFSVLKVDQSIVREMGTSERCAMLVHANVSLAQVLGIEAVPEGIETEDIYETLLHSGCSEGQGYYMSRPLPLDEYLSLLRRAPVWPHSHAGLLRAVLMNHVVELRRVMDWMYAAQTATVAKRLQGPLPLNDRRQSPFVHWYEGHGNALRGNRAFEAMRLPNEILNETYDTIRTQVGHGDGPDKLAGQLSKLAHYSVMLIGDLLRLESEILLNEMRAQRGDLNPQSLEPGDP